MKPNKLFILIFVFILLVPLVTSQPFTQIIEEKVEIQFPLLQVLEQNKNFTFNFHIFNTTSGIIFDNTTHECIFHLFDNKGTHIINQLNTTYQTLDKDFEVTATTGNFSRIGEYSFLVICTAINGGAAGSVSVRFIVTKDGLPSQPTAEALNNLPIVLGIITAMLFFGVLGYLTKFEKIKSLLFGIKFLSYGVSIVQLMLLVFILLAFNSGVPLTNLLRVNFYIIMFSSLGLGFTALIFTSMNLINISREQENEEKNKKWQ